MFHHDDGDEHNDYEDYDEDGEEDEDGHVDDQQRTEKIPGCSVERGVTILGGGELFIRSIWRHVRTLSCCFTRQHV